MFAYIKGSLEVKTKGYIIVDVGGVGYKIFMSETAIQKLGELGETVKIHTYLRVREDDMSLYGFNNNDELRLFELLLTVSGIGAKLAIQILSNITPSSFIVAVISDDVSKIKKLPGVGPKTAQRLILELKDKLKKDSIEDENMAIQEEVQMLEKTNENIKEAIAALQVLGYTKLEIEQALKIVNTENITVEEIIRMGLKNLAK